MANSVKVNTNQLKNSAKKINDLTMDMIKQINSLYVELAAISKNWKDKASYSFIEQFNKEIDNIEDFNKLICKACVILEATAEMYDSTFEDCKNL